MRRIAVLLAPALLLAACATPGDLPSIRYLDAGARGASPPPVSEDQFRRQAELWRNAVVDAGACRLPPSQVLSAGFAARSELTAMRDHTRGMTDGVIASVLGDIVLASLPGRVRPRDARCGQLARWLPTVQRRRDEAGDWSLLERLIGGARP
jgi:hypothetical protein